MKKNKSKELKQRIQDEIDRRYKVILDEQLSGDEFNEQMEVIRALEESLKEAKITDNLDINVAVKSGTSLIAILLILNFEKIDIITSKGFGIATKLL